MTPETLNHWPQQEVQPQPEYVLIEASIEALDQQANFAREAINSAYEAAPDETKQRIDTFEEGFEAAVAAASQKGEAQPSLSSFLETAEGLPDEFKTGVLAYESVVTKIEASEAELEKYAPEKAVVVAEQAKKLEASLDYDKVVAAAFADDDRVEPPEEGMRLASINLLYDVSKVVSLRKALDSSIPTTYHELTSIEHSLSAYESEWQEQGLLEGEASESTETATVALGPEHIKDIEAHIKDVYAVRSKYKKFDQSLTAKTQKILHLTEQIQEAEEPPESIDEIYRRGSLVYNEQLDAALNKRLAQKLSELPAEEFEANIDSERYASLVEEARKVDIGEALKNIEVTGSFERLPFAYSEVELKLLLLTTVPPVALASIKRIQFRAMTKEEDKEDGTLGFHRWSEELNGSEIVISDVKVREHYESIRQLMGQHEDAEAVAVFSAKNKMQQTTIHEFGHALHEVLPLAALKRWEEQRSSDPTNITAYVKDRHDSNHMHRYMEDFADTMALFINQPELLTVTSPVRFKAMQQIFSEFMPLYTDVTQKMQERRITTDRTVRLSNGVSDSDVKSAYLSHETT